MEFQYFGGNSILVSVKGRKFYFDNWTINQELGKKSSVKDEDVILMTQKKDDQTLNNLTFDSPGEYEVSDVSIVGIPSKAFTDSESNLTMFKISTNEVNVLITGNVNPEISDALLEKIGMIDILIVPAGGSSVLGPNDALKIVKSIEPKIFIPTFYKEASGQFYALDEIVSQLGMEISEKTNKYKPKLNELTDKTQLVILEKQ